MESREIRESVFEYLCSMPGAKISKENTRITFENESMLAEVNFYDFYINEILELTITDQNLNEVTYYLHFELVSMEDTKQFLESFFSVFNGKMTASELPSTITRKDLRVLLCCTGGLSTYLFASMMEEALQGKGSHIEVSATRLSRVDSMQKEYDIILMAPQVGYKYEEYHEKYGDKVRRLNPTDFATLNVGKVLGELMQTV